MDIAFVMPWFLPMPPVRGGAVETLVQGLIDQNELTGRFHMTVFTLADAQAEALYLKFRHTSFVPVRVSGVSERAAWFVRGVLNKTVRYHLTPGLAYLSALMRAMRGRRFDRVIVENQAPFVPALARLNVGPIDLHMHNIAILNEQQHPERVAGMCRQLICVSDYIAGWLRTNMAAPEDKCRVLLNCVDAPRFSAGRGARERMRAQLGIDSDAPVFMFTGRICREKGGYELARAFKLAGMKGAHLVFVGSAWFGSAQQDEYMTSIKRELEPCGSRVHFTGYVDHDLMPEYYAAADVAVMPSTWDEPGALTVLEAQAAGVPVITTHSGGMAQNVCPEGAILLERGAELPERLARAMRALAQDADARRRMSQSALEWSVGRDMRRYYDGFARLMEDQEPVRAANRS